MYRRIVIWILVGFASVPPHAFAEEALSAESTAQSTGELLGQTGVESTKATVVALGPELSSTLVVGTTLILATATAYKMWRDSETRRRYREAAAEGAERLARGEITPISNSDPESSLRQVAELERQARPDILQYPEYVSEGNVVRLIVARAKQLE